MKKKELNFFDNHYFQASSPSNWDVPKQNHWGQQDESMGVLQNMWNMNSFGNTPNGGVVRLTRNDNQQTNE